MKESKRVTIALAVVLTAGLAFVPASCSKKGGEAAWKADIVTVDGVRTVRNPETPRNGTFAFDLVEDLVIGDEKSEAYFFPGWVTISVDGAGSIYASDSGKRVQVYDRNGSYVRTLGRQGQGPGEYPFAQAVSLDDAGNAYIITGRSLVVFDKEGLFQRNILLKTFLQALIIGPDGTIIGRTQPNIREDGGPKYKLIQLDPDGEMLQTIAAYPVNGASPGQVLYHWYVGQISFCPRLRDSFFYGFSLDYKIHVVNGEGRELLSFSKTEKSQEINSQEADLTREEGIFAWYGQGDPKTAPLGMPDHRPFFSRFLSDDLGRLYVVRFRPITEKALTSSEIDVFSKDGYYLYRMTWPFLPQVIKRGFLYEVRQDEDKGLTMIIRHRIRNWGDFRVE